MCCLMSEVVPAASGAEIGRCRKAAELGRAESVLRVDASHQSFTEHLVRAVLALWPLSNWAAVATIKLVLVKHPEQLLICTMFVFSHPGLQELRL